MTQIPNPSAQADLFANGMGELLAEIRRHGGRTPPRFIADVPENDDEEKSYFSPVQYGEAVRAGQGRTDNVVSLSLFAQSRR